MKLMNIHFLIDIFFTVLVEAQINYYLLYLIRTFTFFFMIENTGNTKE